MSFLEKLAKKGLKNHYPILSIWNKLGTKFQLKLTILNFWTKLTQKGYSQSKKENKKHHRILFIRISLSSIF